MSGEGLRVRDGAVCALLVAACGALGIYLPVLSLAVAVLLPAFPALLTIRHDAVVAAAALVVAGVFLAWPLKPAGAALVLLQLGLPGLVLGLVYKNRMGALAGFLTAVAGQFFFAMLAWAWIWASSGRNPFSTAHLQAAWSGMIGRYVHHAGSSAAVAGYLAAVGRAVVLLWPGIMVVVLAAGISLAYLWVRFVLKRRGGPVPDMLPFALWRLPWYGIWSLIAGISLWLAGSQFKWAWVSRLGVNLLCVVAAVYLVAGVAVAAFHYRRLAGLRLVRALVVIILVVYLQISVVLFILAGIIDSVVGLRGRPGKN